MIDLVYKVGSNTEDNYQELRYSIRSAVRHLKGLNHIFIIGTKPSWLDAEKITFLPLGDPYTHNKDANLINKLILACGQEGLTDDFLNMSDDYIFLQDMRKEDFEKPFTNNQVIATLLSKVMKAGTKLTKWETRIQHTINALKTRKLPAECYETHCPQLLNKKLYPGILLNYDYGEGIGMCGNTLYYNTLQVKSKQLDVNNLLRIEYKQLKLNDIEALVTPEKQLLNYTVTAYNSTLAQFLGERFVEKCSFEL